MMNKITKEMCLTFVKDYINSKSIFSAIFLLFVLPMLWLSGLQMQIKVPITVAIVGFVVFSIIKTKRRVDRIGSRSFYLVEDVVVDFSKKFHPKKHGSSYTYTYTFERYGVYTIDKSNAPTFEISFHKDKSLRHLPVENAAIQSRDIGDRFYLIILVDGGHEKIVKGFYKYYYEVDTDDFDFIDGRYYIK